MQIRFAKQYYITCVDLLLTSQKQHFLDQSEEVLSTKGKEAAGRCVAVRPLHTVPLIRLQVPRQRPCDCSGQTDAAPELGYLRPGFGLGFWR